MPSSNPLDTTNYTTLLSGNSWHNGTGSVTFSFPANVPGDTITGLLPGERVFAELAIARANEICNVNLVAAPSGTTGQVIFQRDAGDDGFGYAYYPPDGDVFISTIPDQLAAAFFNTGWQTYIHELGHALGLRHPFDSSPFLAATLDTQQYTVMSYDPHPDQASLPLLDQAWPATYMLYDIQALQSIYGANMSTRNGNTTYFGNSGEYALADGGKIVATIWDGGGVDTIDASNQTGNSVIDLRPGHFSSIGAIANNITIALGVTGNAKTQSAWIENASGGSGDDTMTGNEVSNVLTGGGGGDTLTGGAGNDYLDGGTGNDAMTGGTGNDIFVVDAAGDTVTEAANEGTDRVASSVDWTLADHFENLFLTGLAAINGTGNGVANVIIGNDAANTIAAAVGNDVLRGGAGNDTLDGGEGRDDLNGGLGIDAMAGGGGDDLYYVDALGDSVSESSGQGADRVFSTVDWTLSDHVETLTLTGTAASAGTGNGANNTITGNGAANALSGAGGSDTLNGGAGEDTLTGGAGNDALRGGTGADRFVFALDSIDQVFDFAPGVDKIAVSAAGFGGGLAESGTVVLIKNGAPVALGTGGQFLYDTDDGRLWFDADGFGGTAAIQFARLGGAPTLSAGDFLVLA
jgi:Ca2+-binding RTX toxin-like protein